MTQCLYMGMRPNTHEFLTDAEKKQFCFHCMQTIREGLRPKGFDTIDMNQLLSSKSKEEIIRKLNGFAKLDDIMWDGLKLADLSLIDLALMYKQRELESDNPPMKHVVRDYVYSSIFAYEAIKRLGEMAPMSSLVFNADYTIHLAASLAAQKLGAKTFAIGSVSHRLADKSRIFVYPDIWEVMLFKYYLDWPKWRELPIAGSMIREISDDLLLRWKPKNSASQVYSPPLGRKTVSWREKFKVPADAKLLIAYTSSVDEAISTQKALDVWNVKISKPEQPFNDQIAWLKSLIPFVESKAPDLFLIVRIHPREGKNSIDNIESDHLHELRKEFLNRTPANVRIVWPEEDVSSYELGEEADLVLISWSNIGLELARVGVPVLASMIRITCLPFDDFVVRVKDQSSYFSTLMKMLHSPASMETIRRAYRWYNLSRLGGTIDFSDIRPDYSSDLVLPFDLPRNHEMVEEVITKGASAVEINHRRQIEHSRRPRASDEERDALAEELKRIVVFIMSGQIYPANESIPIFDSLQTEGPVCILHDGDKAYRRSSLLVTRLIQLLRHENAGRRKSSSIDATS